LTLAQVGLEMVAPLVVGVVLDFQLGWKPWGIVVGAFLGLILGLVHIVAIVSKPKDSGSLPRSRDEA
jgi:F0F1-type ATP synthase assembly protein I